MIFFYLLLLISPICSFADAAPKISDEEMVQEEVQADITKLSQAFGHLIGKNMETLGVHFDVEQVAKGLKDAAAGKTSPMTEEECVQALTSVQETLFKKQAQDNLKSAETFLSQNAKDKNVVQLHEGKLQYKIEKDGQGAVIDAHATPLVRYVGKYLDGTVFGASKTEETLSLEETIAGIKEGLLGMKEGEKRVIYIHPDLAYGGTSALVPPNSLLTFEVELVQANCTGAEQPPSISTTGQSEEKSEIEIASPNEKRETVR